MMPKIIGIVGRRQVGKDVIANHLKSNYNYSIKKFASPMKESLKILFDLSNEQVEGNLKETIDPRWKCSPRKIMQFFGTEIMQFKLQELMPELKREFAVKRMFINPLNEPKIVISDVRFQHEVDIIKSQNGILIHVFRDIHYYDYVIDNHASEASLDYLTCNYDIYNDKSVNDLVKSIDNLILFEQLK